MVGLPEERESAGSEEGLEVDKVWEEGWDRVGFAIGEGEVLVE